MKNKFSIALSLAVILSMLLSSLAFADNIKNDVVASPASITLDAGDPLSAVDVEFYVQATSGAGDPDPKCNFDTTSEALTFQIITPTGVTANPNEVTFTQCHEGSDKNTQKVTFTASASAVSDYISFTTKANTTGGDFNYGNAVFYVNVVAPPTPSDTTPPTITPSVIGTPGNNGWYVSDVTVSWTVVDSESAISSSSGCDATTINADTLGTTLTCTATSAGGIASEFVTIKRDATAPGISASISPARPSSGWWNTASGAPKVSFTCSDATSGIVECPADHTFGEGENQPYSGTVYDNAGNSASDGVSDIDVDLAAPSVSLVGGPADGSSFYYGFGPAAPTCSASDALSGLDGTCTVSAYDTTVGTHTVTASATDNAGNSASASATYTVLAWTLKGFYQPVDMSGVLNVVKGGSTVPLKFEVFAGSTELTSISVVKSFVQTKMGCDGTLPVDDIEFTTTGQTSLRYDSIAGQFIQNWQTPKLPGQCYRVTMTTQDDSTITAFFKLK